MRTSRVRVGRSVVVGVILAVMATVAAPASAQAAAQVTVTPSSGLLDAQVVTVSGSGFAPNGTAYVSMCLPGATDAFDCDSRQYPSVPIDAAGSFTVQYRVIRFVRAAFDTTTPPTDCAVAACTIGAADFLTGTGTVVYTPVDFADVPRVPPEVTLTPDTGLVDGQTVRVEGTGFRPGETVALRQCPPGATAESQCTRESATTNADASGAISTDITVSRILRSTYAECAPAECTIGVSAIGGFDQLGIGFAEPQLSISVDPYATLKAGTDDVVAQATISCDIATPVSLFSDITQPDIQYRYVLNGQQCTPEEPLLAFLPSRYAWVDDADFTLGTAGVTVTAFPQVSLDLNDPPGLDTEQTASVELIDYGLLLTAIQQQLADPANTDIREKVVRAIGLRVAQDPVFRAEFIAALNAG